MKLKHSRKTRHIPKLATRWYGDRILLLLKAFLSSTLLLNFTGSQLQPALLKERRSHSHKEDAALGLSGTYSAKIHWDIQTKALNFIHRIPSTAGQSGWHLLISIQSNKATKEVCVKEGISAEEKNDKSISTLRLQGCSNSHSERSVHFGTVKNGVSDHKNLLKCIFEQNWYLLSTKISWGLHLHTQINFQVPLLLCRLFYVTVVLYLHNLLEMYFPLFGVTAFWRCLTKSNLERN